MKKNTAKEYEQLVGDLYDSLSENDLLTTVELNVKLPTDKGTDRQFDVVIRTNAAGVKLLIVVEAKDWKHPVPLEIVDALASKMRSVKAHKGIIVARNGFQSGAITEASSYDIDLCTANNLADLSHFKAKIPVVVHFLPLDRLSIATEFSATFPTDGLIDYSSIFVDGRCGLALFRDELFSGKLSPTIRRPLSDDEKLMEGNIEVGSRVIDSENYEVPMNIWRPDEGSKQRYNDPKSGYQIPIRNFEVKYQLIYQYYFGYMDELENTCALENITTSSADLFYDPSKITDFQRRFKKFDRIEDIAVTEAVNFHFIGDIDLDVYANVVAEAES